MLAGSGSYEENRKFLPSGWKNVDVDMSVAQRKHSNPSCRFIACLLQGIKVIPLLSKYDVILSTGTMNGVVLALLQSFTKIRYPRHVIIDIALPRLISPKRKILLAIAKVTFSSVSKVICFASKQTVFWNSTLDFNNKAVFVPLGIDKAYSSPDKGRVNGRYYVFSAGSAARDYDTLIKAFMGISADLRIVAGRDPMTGKTQIKSLIPHNVSIEFEIPKNEYKELLANALFVVVPLLDVSFVCGQSVILDAMFLGKTVIATRGLSTVDYICDGKTGFLVRPRNIEDLRAKMLFLINNPSEAIEIGKNAQIAVATNFNQDLMAKNIGSVLEKCLSVK